MKDEILAAVVFLVRFMEKNESMQLDPIKLDAFKSQLIELLTERFRNHWFPDAPTKGQGYRCIRVNELHPIDKVLQKAATQVGLSYNDLQLPIELTLWVDPNEVCCRFGESEGSYCVLATFSRTTQQENDSTTQQQRATSTSPASSDDSSSSSTTSSSSSSLLTPTTTSPKYNSPTKQKYYYNQHYQQQQHYNNNHYRTPKYNNNSINWYNNNKSSPPHQQRPHYYQQMQQQQPHNKIYSKINLAQQFQLIA